MPTTKELKDQLRITINNQNVETTSELRKARSDTSRLYQKALNDSKAYQSAKRKQARLERKRTRAINKLKRRKQELQRSLIKGGPTEELATKIFKLQDDVQNNSY